MISKDISLDEKVNTLSNDTVRLLFTWLIPHLDVEGRMHGDALTFRSIVTPRRNISLKKIEEYLEELEKHELILRYSVNGNQYLCAPNFEKHQIGLRKDKETISKIPPYLGVETLQKDGVRTELGRTEDGTRTELGRNDSVKSPPQVEIKDQVKVKVKEKKTSKEVAASKGVTTEYLEEMRKEFLGLNVDRELKKCASWWQEHKKKEPSPRALLNWLDKAEKDRLKEEPQHGTVRGDGAHGGEGSDERTFPFIDAG